jgi:hypothetical protein
MSFFPTGSGAKLTFFVLRYEALTDASVRVYPFLSRFKPFFFALVIGFIVVFNLTLALGYFLNFSATTPMIIIYIIISVAFLVFYSVTVSNVTKKVTQANNMRQGNKMKLQLVIPKKEILNLPDLISNPYS